MEQVIGLPKYESILCATDGSDYSRVASRHAVYLAKLTGARLCGAYVVNTHAAMHLGIYYGEALREMQEEGKEALEDIGKLAEAAGVQYTPLMASGNPKSAILEVAVEQQSDLIVVGSHGQSGLERALLGSVSDYVLHHAECSVLVVRKGPGGK